MSQCWSVCHVSETAKQTGVGKSTFLPSFLEKENQWLMIDILYGHYCNAKCVLQSNIVSLRQKAKISSPKNIDKITKDNLNDLLKRNQY